MKPNIKAVKSRKRPVALILAGYGAGGFNKRRRFKKEIHRAYGSGELYAGKNKFLINLEGKPVIQYILDAVYGARKGGRRLYNEIYIYNDTESFLKEIDLSDYPGVYVRQMTQSLSGHIADFLHLVEDGQRIDVYYGDTTRVTAKDVEYVYGEYGKVYRAKENPVTAVFGIVRYADLQKNTWLPSRMKKVLTGHNRGKHRAFVGFDSFEARIANCASFVKTPEFKQLVKKRVMDTGYQLRKALTPSTLSRIVYYLWKTDNLAIINDIRKRCINEQHLLSVLVDVISRVYKIDLRRFRLTFLHVKKNAAHWENDLDGPKDYRAIVKKMRNKKNDV